MNTIDITQLLRALQAAFKTLSERERTIILMRNGLVRDAIPRTLEEVGKEIGLTRERIRQIEAKALERIRVFPRHLELIHNTLAK